MSPWQVLRAGRATQAALGYHVHHVPGGLVHYSAAPAVAAAALAPDSSRSFCLSREKVTLQQLNNRLAMYLQQVQHLEATNQHLECEIQRELNRKCPRELMELDRHLRTVSLLQEQISNCLSAQAQVKLQLLNAELTVFDLSVRYEKECERRGALEVELSNLRLLDEELQVHRLPELHNQLNDRTQHLTELQIQHEQDMQGLLAQMSGGVSVEMHPVESLDLIQQLYGLRQTGVVLPDNNQNECWFNNQISMLSSPEVAFEPPEESEVIRVELQELRTTAVSLEEELRQLQTQNMVLEASGLEQNQSFVQQLVILQQTADSLCADLDSVLQTAAQQAAHHQTLLDIKTRLEAEIQEYRRLLDGLSPQGVSSLHPVPVSNFTSFCVTSSPSAFRSNIRVDRALTLSAVQEGSLRMTEAQAASGGHIHTPIASPLSEMVTTVQSTRFHDKHSRNSPITSIYTSNLIDSFIKSENQGTEAFPETARREPMSISATVNQQSPSVEDKVHTEDGDLQNLSLVIDQIRHGVDKGAAAKDSNPESGSFTFKQTATEAGLLVNKTGTNIQTEITRSIVFAEQDVKQRPHFMTHITTTEPSVQASAEAKKATESVVSVQMNCVESFNQAENQDHGQMEPLSLEIQAEAGEVVVVESCVSGSHILRSEEAQDKVCGDLTLTDAATGSVTADASSGILDSSDNLETKTAQGIITLVSDMQPARSAAGWAKPESFNSKQTATDSDKTETSIQTVITKTIPCAEPEVKQGPHVLMHMTIADLSKQTAAEVQQTATVVSAQMNSLEASIQTENQDPLQVVPLRLEMQAEAVRDSDEVAITESCVSGSHILRSEEAQDKVSGDLALMDDRDIDRQKEKEEVEVNLPALRLDQSSALSHVSNSEQNKVVEGAVTGSVTADASCGILDSSDNLESKATKGIVTLVSDMQPARSAAGQAKPESFNSKQTATEADKTETSIETVITKTILRPEEAQAEVSGVLNFNGDRDMERQAKKGEEVAVEAEGTVPGHRLDQSLLLSSSSNNKQYKIMGDAVTGSHIPTTSTGSPDGNGNKLNEAAITETMKKVELEVHNGKTVNSFHVTSEVNVDPNELDNKTINLTGQDALLRTAESKKSTHLTDSGMTLSSFKSEEPLSPEEVHVFSYEVRRPTRPTSHGLGHLLSSLVGLELGGQDHHSIMPDKEEQLSLGNQHIVRNVGDTAYNKNVQQSGGGPGGSCGSYDQKETTEEDVKGQKKCDRLVANIPDNSKGLLNECVKSTSISTVPPNEGTTFSVVTSNSGVMAISNSGWASDLAAGSGGTTANSSGTVGGNAEAATTAGGQGRFRRDSGEWMVYGGSVGHKTSTRSKENLTGAELHATGQQDTGKLSISKSGEQRDGCSLDGSTSLNSEGKEESPSVATKPAQTPQEKGRFSSRGSGEWIVYSGSLGRKKTLPRTRSEEIPSATTPPETSAPETRRFSSTGSEEWVVCGGSLIHSSLAGSDSLLHKNRKENLPTTTQHPTSPPGGGRFGSRGSGEWRVYGGSTGRISISASSNSLPSADKEEESTSVKQQTSPSGSLETGRFANGGSGEWRVYGGSTGRLSRASSADRVSVSANSSRHTTSEPKLSSAGSGGKLNPSSVVKRSSSVGSGGRLSSSGSGGRLSSSSGSYKTSTSGRYSSTGSSEWKPVYSSASARKSSLGSIGRSGGGGKISSQKAPSSGGRMHVSMGSLGWLTGSAAGGNCISSSGSGSKLSSADSSDRISSRAGGRISSSSGSGRTNSTGGRVISSSDWPVRSTGSATGGNKERISVCKMAALSISAAGRERSQDKQRQQKQAADSSALMQRWLNTDVRVNSTKPGGHDDLTRL
uniref:uncharacterized protein LOC124073108 n=1 Tax=Scatophagus argus TaxID=75038 RepID=UPI001ED7FC2B|nr:uncharacterized protein LOC124073108 [Scatophagus argus]